MHLFLNSEDESADTNEEESMSDGNENKVAVSDERPPISEKVVSDKFASEEQFQNVWNQLPNEIVENILVNSVMYSKSPIKTYESVSRTCSRFRGIIMNKIKKESLIPRVHLTFPDGMVKNLPTFDNKITISVRRFIMVFGPTSGAVSKLSEMINVKNWKSSWVILRADEYSWFQVEKVFWKNSKNNDVNHEDVADVNKFWLKNDLYNLLFDDQQILRSPTAWLNDRIMDAAQKLICKELGLDLTVLNVQKRGYPPFYPVDNEHVQLLHDGNNHWLLTICSSGRVQICDSLRPTLSRATKRSVDALYRNFKSDGQLLINHLPVQRQPDGYNFGPFAVAFAAEIVHGLSPVEAEFDVKEMRKHLMKCIIKQQLSSFPKKHFK